MALSTYIDLAIWLIFATVWSLAFSQSRHRALNFSFVVLVGCCTLFSLFVFAEGLPICAPYTYQLIALAGFFQLIVGVLFAQFFYRLINRQTDICLWLAYGWTILTLLVYVIDPRAAGSLIHFYNDIPTTFERGYFAALFMTPILSASLGIWRLLQYWRRSADRSQNTQLLVVWCSVAVVVFTVAVELIWPLMFKTHVPFELGMGAIAGIIVVAFVELRRRSLFEVDSDQAMGRLLLDVDEGVAVADCHGRIRQMNPWMKELLGVDPADDQPREMTELLPWAQDADDGKDVEFQLHRDGALHFYRLSKAGFFRGGRLAGEVCFVDDISDAKRTEELGRLSRVELEREVARRSEEFFQTQKMAAVGALAPGIVHDFNNMLATIIGLGSAAKKDVPHDHAVSEDIDEILQAAYRARDLVRQIPTERSAQTVERTVVKLGHIVDDVIGQVAVSLGNNIEIKHSASESSSFVMGNPTQLHQLVLNLANNAIQEMKHTGGELSVQLDALELDGAGIGGQPALEDGLYVRLRVSDTGRGMDEETLGRVFEPFFTTKQTGEGTGLGLAMARKVALEHDGAILAASRLGEGSSFTVYMPSIVHDSWQTISPECVVEGGDEHLLIVDDDESVAHAMERMMGTLGYRATVVHDPFEALLLFKNAPGDFDVVLTDYSMPGMNGLNLASAMFEEQSSVPIVLITGVSDNDELQAEAVAVGVREVMVKPVTPEAVAGVVRRVVAE